MLECWRSDPNERGYGLEGRKGAVTGGARLQSPAAVVDRHPDVSFLMTILMEEIVQQPAALAALRKYYESPGAISVKALKKLVTKWPPIVVFTGMGSSLNAAYPAQAYLTSRGIRAIVWETAELLHHHLSFLRPDTLLVAVSQSGETVEITRLLNHMPEKVGLAAVVNVEGSTLARRGHILLPMMAGEQRSVSTKTYMCSVAVLMYLAFALTGEPHRRLTQILMQAIEAQERVLDQHDVVTPPTVEFFNHPTYVALMSRGADMASVCEGALLLKEVVRVGAEPISAAQFRHGPIEIINPAHRYIIFARQWLGNGHDGRRSGAAKLLLKLTKDVQSHGGRVLLLTDLPFENLTNLRLLRVDPIKLGLGTLVDMVHIQLLAHDLAVGAGRDPGKFWIAEGVTKAE
jgi:glucosamine--fructose-6-phosphate aminotransferase (isomerizing)